MAGLSHNIPDLSFVQVEDRRSFGVKYNKGVNTMFCRTHKNVLLDGLPSYFPFLVTHVRPHSSP